MWFLSAGPPHHLRPPCLLSSLLLSSSELGWDSLVWKWILLPNCAKHQIRALILWIILFVTLTSALVPLFLPFLWTVCRHGQCSSYFLLFSIILGGFFAFFMCTFVCVTCEMKQIENLSYFGCLWGDLTFLYYLACAGFKNNIRNQCMKYKHMAWTGTPEDKGVCFYSSIILMSFLIYWGFF